MVVQKYVILLPWINLEAIIWALMRRLRTRWIGHTLKIVLPRRFWSHRLINADMVTKKGYVQNAAVRISPKRTLYKCLDLQILLKIWLDLAWLDVFLLHERPELHCGLYAIQLCATSQHTFATQGQIDVEPKRPLISAVINTTTQIADPWPIFGNAFRIYES